MLEVEFLRYAFVATSPPDFAFSSSNADEVQALRNFEQANLDALFASVVPASIPSAAA